MGNNEEIRREDRFPGEVVEVYRQKDTREVVEIYVRPLPGVSLAKKEAEPKKKKRDKKGFWIFLLCAVIAVTLAILAWALDPMLSWQKPGEAFRENLEEELLAVEEEEIEIPRWTPEKGVKLEVCSQHGETMTAQEVYRQVNPAVVTVMVQSGTLTDRFAVGSGVIFDEDGYLITNYHVVAGGVDCVVTLDDGYTYQAKYVAGDPKSDLAILKADASNLPVAEFGDSEQLVVGDPVYAIGNPLGVELRGTLTDGIVSAINRDVWVNGRTMSTLIQTNAALNTGNSGGPLINEYGQVVGINVVKMSSSYSSGDVEGLGFAIPSASIDRLVNDMLTYGEVKPEPLLGMSVAITSTQVEEDLWGLEVMAITPGSAAESAGVLVGDYVLSMDGQETLTSQDVLRIRRQHYVGDKLQVTLWRESEIVEMTLDLQQAVE